MKPSKKAVGGKPKGRRFSTEFKREAVRILEGGRKATQLSRELGVSTFSLWQWKKLYGTGVDAAGGSGRSPKSINGGDASVVQLADELAQVKAELYTITRQRDILKKALAILGQESANGIL